mmetsp:Transcript_8071/g.21243  ORF Transcript_8071/g.21243 Transcript_8071/m.21243 type:complete len:206 (+) Transcript_8071:873-1490(+)
MPYAAAAASGSAANDIAEESSSRAYAPASTDSSSSSPKYCPSLPVLQALTPSHTPSQCSRRHGGPARCSALASSPGEPAAALSARGIPAQPTASCIGAAMSSQRGISASGTSTAASSTSRKATLSITAKPSESSQAADVPPSTIAPSRRLAVSDGEDCVSLAVLAMYMAPADAAELVKRRLAAGKPATLPIATAPRPPRSRLPDH